MPICNQYSGHRFRDNICVCVFYDMQEQKKVLLNNPRMCFVVKSILLKKQKDEIFGS